MAELGIAMDGRAPIASIAAQAQAADVVARGVAERAVAGALLHDAVDIDVGKQQRRLVGKARGFGDLGAQLVDGELAGVAGRDRQAMAVRAAFSGAGKA